MALAKRRGGVLRAAARSQFFLFAPVHQQQQQDSLRRLPRRRPAPARLASRMVAVSDDLIWLLVKNNNRFLVKRNGNNNNSVQFSSEANNLYNLNTFKYSGLANKKTVAIAPAEGLSVNLTTTKTKKRNQPAKVRQSSHLKKDFRRMAKTVVNQVATNGYRADLKAAALARLAAVHKSLRVSKAGVTKKKSKARTPVARQ